MKRRFPLPRFTLKRVLIVLIAIACIMGLLANWHSRSMEQYRALNTEGTDDGVFCTVEFTGDLQKDPNTGEWTVSPDAGFSKYAIQAWLCRYFEPSYACDAVGVYLSSAGQDEMQFVNRLKGVRRIVLPSESETEIVNQWRNRFPSAEIMTYDDLDAREYEIKK